MNPNKNNPIEDEIDAIRIGIYEKTKDMTNQEQTDYFNRRSREIMKKHGLKATFVKTANDGTPPSRP